tara:strand:- start:850 stop:1041 length:192 start_codon:yes stop_codon:yes gene_type:complete
MNKEEEIVITDDELIEKFISMGYTKEVALKMAKSRKHMEKKLASESIIFKINKFIEDKYLKCL